MEKERTVMVISKEGDIYIKRRSALETEDQAYVYLRESESLKVPFLDRTNHIVDFAVAGYVGINKEENFMIIAIPKEISEYQRQYLMEESHKIEEQNLFIYSFEEKGDFFRTYQVDAQYRSNEELLRAKILEKSNIVITKGAKKKIYF